LATNPLAFLADIKATGADAHAAIMDLYSILNTPSLSTIAELCGDENKVVATNTTLHFLDQNILSLQGSLAAVMELSGCSSISPIFRRLLFGSLCTQSLDGLGCIYFTLLSISILGFVIVSTRAALFNPVIRGRRSKRREKEFADYKQFMSRFYDTSNWELDWIPNINDDDEELDTDLQFPMHNSEDTQSTPDISPIASDETNNDDAANTIIELAPTTVTSKDGSVFVNLAAPDDDKCDEDSYDSTYSSDDGEIQSTSSHSNLSMMFLRRRNQYQQHGDNPDELLSSMSSSSLLDRFLKRRNARDGLVGDALHNLESDVDNESEQEDFVDDDSVAGVMLTPLPVRYPLHRRGIAKLSHGPQPRSEYASSPDDFSLTPSPEQPTALHQRHVASSKMFPKMPRSSIL
jgi:hypothetical protein